MAKRPDWFVQSIGYAGPLEDCVIADGWLGVKTHDLPADEFSGYLRHSRRTGGNRFLLPYAP